MDTRDYWRRVRQQESTLPEVSAIVSLDDSRSGVVGGRVFFADRETAAKCIIGGSHRIATPDEITAYESDQRRRFEESTRADRERNGITCFTVKTPLPKARR